MARYQRQHSGPNLSNGMSWILGICAVAFVIYKVVSCNQVMKAAHQYEETGSDTGRQAILNDSIR